MAKMHPVYTNEENSKDKVIVPIIIALSVIVPIAVAILIMFNDVLRYDFGISRSTLPAFHAILNGTTAVLLILGLYFISQRKIAAHRLVMVMAFSLSAVFLVSYVISKLNAEPVPYGGEGFFRGLYFFILVTHIILSVPVLPLAMFAIYRGTTKEYAKHKKIVRYTFPIWLYVAVTGVLVYFFMQPYY
jgi:putative membrane protein